MSDNLVKRLRDTAFSTETTERNLMSAAADRIEGLEAKLAKAVWALEKINVGEGWAAHIARINLEELKGQNQ
jgi:hypothetical protein